MGILLTSVIVVASCLFGSAALAVVRRRKGRTRWQRLFQQAPGRGGLLWAVRWRRRVARAWQSSGAAWWGPLLGAGPGVAAGLVMSGPVAAVVTGAYVAAGIVVLRRRAQHRSRARAYRVAADAVAALAADLRAGMAQDQALLSADKALLNAADLPGSAASVVPITRRVAAAVAVAQASGAPLADVLERLDAHLRATDRVRAMADTQAAGARASAVLLAALPLAGVGLGAAIGVDPVRVLFHTRPGGVALCAAVALQLGGLAWTSRLARVDVAT